MKRLLIFLLFASSTMAQGAFVQPQSVTGTVNGALRALPGATITVCASGTSGIPCSPALASTIFKDTALTQPLANPFTADANGNYQFAVAPGTYTVTQTAVGFSGYSYQISVNGCGSGSTCSVGTLVTVGGATIGGGLTVNGSAVIVGSVTAVAGQNSINFGASDNIVYIDGTTYPRTCAGINSAIAAAPGGAAASGTIIQVGYGDVSCGVTILMDKPITLRMSGEAGRIVPSVGFAGPVIKTVADSNSVVNQYSQAIGMRLENVWIEDTAFRSQNTDGIWLTRTDEMIFDKVVVKWLRGYALQLDNNGSTAGVVRESTFDKFISWGCGDPAQSKASIMLITSSAAGSDEINEIRFVNGGVKAEWWEAVRISTGQTAGVSAPLGPRQIFFDNFQIESRATLDCAGSSGGVACIGSLPPAVPPFSDNVHIVQGNNIYFRGGSMSNAGQGKSSIRIDGTSNNPVIQVSLDDMVVGGNPQLAGFVSCTNVANSICTWQSGNQFLPVSNVDWAGLTISIPSAACTTSCVIASQQSATQITLTTNTGTVTNQAYTVTSGGFGITESYLNSLVLKGVKYLGNPNGNLNPTIANAGNYVITEHPGTGTISTNSDSFGLNKCFGTDCVVGYQNLNGGQEWLHDSTSGGNYVINPRTSTNKLLTLNNFLIVDGALPAVKPGNTSTALGAAALPWNGFFLGTAATNNFNFVPAATAAARTVQVNDPGATSAVLLGGTNLLVSPIAPTIAAAGCGGGAATISNNNGTAAFEVNVGTTPGSACTITMPAAAHKWICTATDFTTNSTSVFLQKQSPVASQTTTQIVITNFSDVAAATAFVASDIMGVSCHAY